MTSPTAELDAAVTDLAVLVFAYKGAPATVLDPLLLLWDLIQELQEMRDDHHDPLTPVVASRRAASQILQTLGALEATADLVLELVLRSTARRLLH